MPGHRLHSDHRRRRRRRKLRRERQLQLIALFSFGLASIFGLATFSEENASPAVSEAGIFSHLISQTSSQTAAGGGSGVSSSLLANIDEAKCKAVYNDSLLNFAAARVPQLGARIAGKSKEELHNACVRKVRSAKVTNLVSFRE